MIRSIGVVMLVVACGSTRENAGTDAASAGSGSATDAPAWTSGSRIKARTTVTTTTSPDGASYETTSFGGWYDSARAEPCAPEVAADGKTRCLPASLHLQISEYGDAGCTIPVVVGGISYVPCPDSPEVPKYVADQPASTCPPTGKRIYAVATSYPNYYVKSGAACQGPYSVEPPLGAYSAGAEIPASAFAEMSVTTTTTP